jgi:ankyrin
VETLIRTRYPNAPAPDKWTPLQHAARNGHAKIVELLAPTVDDANAPTPDGYTPAQLAARYGHVEVTKYFVSILDNPNDEDILGFTPVQCAIKGGHWEVVRIFALFVDNDEAKDALGWSSIYTDVMVSDSEDPLSFNVNANEDEIGQKNDVNENEKKHKLETGNEDQEETGSSPKRAKLDENEFNSPDDTTTKIHSNDNQDSNPKNESFSNESFLGMIEKNDSNDYKRKMENNDDEEDGQNNPKKAKIENQNDSGISTETEMNKKDDESMELMLEENSDANESSINISSKVEQMVDKQVRCSSGWIPFY